ncbi:unnamed protein product [Chironomus riparius]|uniref:Uncharacterized protein n=1 Tax=Chironomus riparius TaxID=315576 RepID=A0A9N9S818_9DIPT|nr:unnamed protein product [Chironomus riparius]
MTLKLILLFLISLTSFATSQPNFNISAFDSQLHDIFNGLVQTETKVGSFLSNLSSFVGDVNLKLNKSRLYMELSHLQLVLQLQSSIWNYESYQQLTGCSNVASKISEIEVDLMKFADFVDRLELNMTELYQRNLRVTYELMLRPKQMEGSQQDVIDIIMNVNEAMVQYLFYILQLQVNIKYEKSIASNLKLYLKHYCKCRDSTNDVAQMTENSPSIDNMEAPLIGKQARLVSAANNTLSEAQNLTESKNVTGKAKVLTRKVSALCRKIGKFEDLGNSTSLATNSCSILTKNQNFLIYRRFRYTQALSFVSTSSSVLGFFRESFKDILNGTAKQELKSFNSSFNVLDSELKKYATELKYQLSSSGILKIIRQNIQTILLFCGCTAARTETTPTGMTTTKALATTTTSTSLGTKTTTKLTTFGTTSTSSKSMTTSTSTGSPTSNNPLSTAISKTQPTSSSLSTTTPKIQPSLPKTSTLAPYSNPACSFTKTLSDRNGNYIKTACLIETASNGSYANSTCQDNFMQLMAVDSNMTQTALTIFVQETLSEGTFWINGGNGSDICNFIAVNGTGPTINQTKCSWYQYYSICEYKDPKVPVKVNFEPNLDACGLVLPIMGNDSSRYACFMSYTRSYDDSSYNCMLNGMEMFKVAPMSVVGDLNDFFVRFYGKNSGVVMWINGTAQAGSCSFLDGSKNPFEVARGDCDQLYWSICETAYDGTY